MTVGNPQTYPKAGDIPALNGGVLRRIVIRPIIGDLFLRRLSLVDGLQGSLAVLETWPRVPTAFSPSCGESSAHGESRSMRWENGRSRTTSMSLVWPRGPHTSTSTTIG